MNCEYHLTLTWKISSSSTSSVSYRINFKDALVFSLAWNLSRTTTAPLWKLMFHKLPSIGTSI